MILVLAEKPSVARDLARVLGCARREGYFESATHRVAWALGHLVALKDPDEIDEKYKKWRREDLPILPEVMETKVLPRTRAQFSLVKKLMLDPGTERVVCATDAGREGELIFRLIYQKAGCKKPVSRLWVSSLTDAAIREGLEGMKPAEAYDGLYQSALCRAQADWLVGMNASRAFTLRFNALLSVGRVQTPTLAILVEREREIRDFVPLAYYTLTADFGDYQGQYFDPGAKEAQFAHRIPDEARAKEIAKDVKGREAEVQKAETQPKKENPPPLFDLTSLQREANRRLGFTASRTLKAAQSLYENRKALTYPRTDSRHLPRDMISRVNQALAALPEPYATLSAGIPRREGRLPFSPRVFDDAKVTDHHAIIPTPSRVDPAQFTPDERALYDLAARRFIAAFYPAHEYDQTTVVTVCRGHAFKSSGRTVTAAGWKQVISDAAKDREGEAPLPPLKAGDRRTVAAARVKQETTKPPAPHTDASLLSRMERPDLPQEDGELQDLMKKNGLGTPATRAATIERLIEVGYASRRGKAIQATEKGERLISVVPAEIASPVMTGRWEQALEEIARGAREPGRFMEGIRRLAAFLVTAADGAGQGVEFPREARGRGGAVRAAPPKTLEGLSCPLCGKPVTENEKAFGCSAWKEGCRFTLWKDALKRAGGPRLTEPIVRLLLTAREARGSSGTVRLSGEEMSFTPVPAAEPALRVPVRYEKKAKPAAGRAAPAAAPAKGRRARPKDAPKR